jgi:iron(III) transport system permease protein
VVGYLALAALPQLGLLLTALSKDWFMTPLPEQLTVSHFAAVFQHPLTSVSIKNSFFLSATATLFITLLAGLIAFLTARVKLRFAWVLDLFSLLPLAVPGLVFAFGYIGGFSGTLLDPRFSPIPLLLIAYTVRRMPMMVRSANAGLRESHPALGEAAASLGAGSFTIARRITLPLISRHLLAGALLTFTYSMTEVSDSLFLAREERYYPISKALYTLLGRPDGLELAAALGVLITILISVLLLIADRLGRTR